MTVLFDDEDLQEMSERINRGLIGKINNEVDEQYINFKEQQQMQLHDSNQDAMTNLLNNAPAAPYISFIGNVLNDTSGSGAPIVGSYAPSTDEPIPYGPPVEGLFKSDKKGMRDVRNKAMHDLAQLSSGDEALFSWIGSQVSRTKGSEIMSPEDVTAYAREQGMDIKVEKPMTKWEVDRKLSIQKRKEYLEGVLMESAPYAAKGKWNDATMIAASLAGAVGPMELISSTALSFVAPELAVSSLAKGASLVKRASGLKKSADIIKDINRLKNANSVLKGLTDAEKAELTIAGLGYDALSNPATIAKAMKAQEKAAIAAGRLEELEGLTYNAMGKFGKFATDGLSMTVADLPWILGSRWASDKLEVDTYSEQDMAADTLMAFALGVGAPTALRGIASKFGIMPAELLSRKISSVEREVNLQEATGRISKADADEIRTHLNTIREGQEAASSILKRPHPLQEESAEQLLKVNTTSDQLFTWINSVYMLVNAGRAPEISKLPQNESLLSHIDAQIHRGLLNKSAREVYGDNLIVDAVKNGPVKMMVNGETGLLGKAPVAALTEADAEEMLSLMYKGFLMGDIKALQSFYGKTANFAVAVDMLRAIYEKDQSNIKANRASKAQGLSSSVPLSQQVDKPTELADAYLRFKLSDEEFTQFMDARAEGLYTAEQRALDEEALQWANTWFETTDIIDKDTGRVTAKFYDFINPETGRKDKGAAFKRFINNLQDGADGNQQLANAYSTITDIGQERLRNMLQTSMELGYPDTDLVTLMGAPRIVYDDFADVSAHLESSRSLRSLKRLEYNAFMNDEANRAVIKDLSGKKIGKTLLGDNASRFNKYRKLVDDLRVMSANGLVTEGGTPWINAVSDALTKDEPLQATLSELSRLGADAPDRLFRHVKKAFKDAVRSSLNELPGGLVSKIGSRRASQIIRESADIFEKNYKNDPNILMALMSPENVKASKEADASELSVSARNVANRASILAPIQDKLEQAMIDAELAAMNEIDIMASTLSLMKANPAIAAEVLTGRATQTVYPLQGGQLSVEYQSMSVGAYMQGLELRLREASKNNVNDLWDMFKDKNGSYRNEVMEAVTRKLYDSNYQHPNSDVAIIANEILNQQSSFNNRFRRLGTEYVPFRSTPIDRTKLRNIDAFVTNDDISRMNDHIESNISINASDIADSIPTVVGEDGSAMYKFGDKLISRGEAESVITTALDRIKNANDLLQEMVVDSQRKTAYWALRDLDLDAKFDPAGNVAMSMNTVRDALFEGRLSDLLTNDLLSLQDASSAFESTIRYLVGEGKFSPKKDGIARGWVSAIRSGQHDLKAATSGEVAAAVARVEDNLPFKNADVAVRNVQELGYNSIEEMVQAEYHNTFQAFFALKQFGETPAETAKELVEIYNDLVGREGPFREHLREQAKATREVKNDVDIDHYISSRYSITENAYKSAMQNITIACGLDNQAPSTAATLIKTLASFFATKLLMKAGLKSISDYSTIWSGLVLNGLAHGTGDAIAQVGRATKLAWENPKIAQLLSATTVIEQGTILNAMFNNPAMDNIISAKSYGITDKANRASRWYGNMLMNNMGQMERITNNNKRVAGIAICMGVADNRGLSYDQLPVNLQKALLRDGLLKEDWDFIRKNLIGDVTDLVERYSGEKVARDANEMYVLHPLLLNDVPDSTIRAELKSRGYVNINQDVIDAFRDEMMTKVWTMVDASAQEMISMPSQRIQSIMHAHAARNSALGSLAEIITQFQSFGAALTYNTYIKYLSNFTDSSHGITVLDLFNPKARVTKGLREQAFAGLVPVLASIGLTTTIVDATVAALAGQIQRPVDENGVHLDTVTSGMLGALGTTGLLLNAGIEAVGGAGQRGGGLAIQVAPSISEMMRIGYRVSKPLRSSRITPEEKPMAVAGATAQELAKFTGIPTMPVVALAYQALLGSYLDSVAAGNPKEYRRQLKARERRGYVVFPWQERY